MRYKQFRFGFKRGVQPFFVAVGLVSAMVALPVVLTQFASATEKGNRLFLGIWEGIDPTDGSAQQILISGGDNGVFKLLWYETFWSICEGKRGVTNGTGELADKDTLVVDIVISCFDPDADVVADTVTFELVGKDMLLATAGSGVFVDHPLFRVSNR